MSEKAPHLNIAGFSMDILWNNPWENLNRLEQWIQDHPKADVYIVPEMFSTGFNMNPKEASAASDQVIEALKKLTIAYQKALCGSIAIEENGKFYNRMFFITPDDATFYDKRHLFSYSGENQAYSGGRKRVITSYKGWKILLQVCYDLRFPVFSRNTGDYDTAIYVANWPMQRIQAWETLLRARAIENQAYVIGINRTGTDENQLTYPESSYIIDFYGNEFHSQKANGVFGALDAEALHQFRQKFPFLKDRDNFEILD